MANIVLDLRLRNWSNEKIAKKLGMDADEVFDNFENICVSFSGGKDSTRMTHLVIEEAKKRNRKVGLLFIDWEIQYQLTINHVRHVFEVYKDWINPYWVALPLLSDNACSQYEPEWVSWDKKKKGLWVRKPEPISITDEKFFRFGTTALLLKSLCRSLVSGTERVNSQRFSLAFVPAKV